MIYIFLYIYFGFHRPMLGKFTKALLAEMMAGRSSGTFQKRYVYTVCVYFTNCKYVRLGADHYIFRGRGGCTIFLNCCFNFRLRGERNGGNKILHNYYEKVIWYIHFIVV